MTKLEKLSVLAIEANQGMRAQLRSMLESFRITGVSFAPSASAAVRILRDKQFDIIFCDHDLGEGQDGQYLLEDLRNRKIIPRTTLFMMITGERNYERVIGTAELSPDDYILKPLTPGTLQYRLERSLNKRDLLLPLYKALERGDHDEALFLCEQGSKQIPHLRYDFLREQAELLNQRRHFAEAQTLFEQILQEKNLPWAQLGLARMFYAQDKYNDAEILLQELVESKQYFLAAYDWLARTRRRMGKATAAQQTLHHAVDLSPFRMTRLKDYAAVSMEVGDYQNAEKMLSEVVRKSKYSDFRDPNDHVELIRAQLAQERIDEAKKTIRDLEKSMPGRAEANVCVQIGNALIQSQQHNDSEARQMIESAVKAADSSDDTLSVHLRQQLIKACLDNQLENDCQHLVDELLRNAEDEQVISSTHAILEAQGRADMRAAIEAEIHNEVARYKEESATHLAQGNYDLAVQEMLSAIRKLPGNAEILTTGTQVLLQHIAHKGWNEKLAEQVRILINRTRRLDPQHEALTPLTQSIKNLAHKYGINSNHTPTTSETNELGAETITAWKP